jgi:hypothetical protein
VATHLREENRLRMFENWLLRRMFESERDEIRYVEESSSYSISVYSRLLLDKSGCLFCILVIFYFVWWSV